MPNYIQLQFDNLQPEQSAILVAELSELGYDGFEEEEHVLKAFIAEPDFDAPKLTETKLAKELPYTISRIEETNWNAQWESGFQPVILEDFVAIRADFHAPIETVTHEIIITPKMSFGTGHHATTYMMLQEMRPMDFRGKKVADFGTGTGVLAILAEKMGAAEILAIDYDDWSIANALENLERNNCHHITCRQADHLPADEKFDVLLANINKNVILEHLSSMCAALQPGGILLLSGLLESDETDILNAASGFPLKRVSKASRNNWIALKFSR